eukprot:TRINITY_DN15782_c0_g1_i1.p1 TRINITY_DN15782_c0_g1~~TRINITY_DN15782_c0_g1_i1.p1  ORF type:complete len:273 (-),score=78.47 TRINITY_DN15782_c0_g1_i1:169-987(-)
MAMARTAQPSGLLLLPLLLALLLLVCTGVPSEAATTPEQKSALVALYNSTGGPYWFTRWDIDTDPCDNNWYGVLCANSNVYSLSLQSNNLTGTIPSALSGLTSLQFLYLSKNRLSSTLPESLGNLRGLQQVGLDYNQLSGTIPSSFVNLELMQSLYLQDNAFSGPIDWLSGMKQIVYAFMSNNAFNGTIPTAVGEFFLLEQLGLDSNALSGTIPPGFNLQQNFLQAIYLQNNFLSGTLNAALCSVPACFASNNAFSCPLPSPDCCAVSVCNK